MDLLSLEEISFYDYEEITIGIDPASSNDYFALSIFGWNNNNKEEIYLDYENKITLPNSKKKCFMIMDIIMSQNKNWFCTIDSSPIGLDLYQSLVERYGKEYIRGVTGNKRVRVERDNKIKINEYGHTLIKQMMNEKSVSFILDDLAIKHMQSITYKYQPENCSDGHGDICMARLYSLLPKNINSVQKRELKTTLSSNKEKLETNENEEDLLSKIKRMRRKK